MVKLLCIVVISLSSILLNARYSFATGDCHWWSTNVYEVAAGRLCILSNTKGSAENFAQGDENGKCGPIKVKKGSSIAFKNGFGYEMMWHSNASGILMLNITAELSTDEQNWEYYDETTHTYTETGPKIHAGSLDVWIEFNEVGTVYVKTILTAVADPVDGDKQTVVDEIITEVNVN